MTKGLRVFFSHRVESLYGKMRKQLFSAETHPFARRLVVVPSPAMKTWLHLMMAKDPFCGIAAGLEVGYVDQTMGKLMDGMQLCDLKEPSSLELALMIEEQLSAAIAQGEPLWDPVKAFVGGSLYTRKAQRRLTALSLQLARLFVKYGTYGGSIPKKWEQAEGCWQEVLWRRVWNAAPTKAYPIRMVEEALKGDSQPLVHSHIEVHLFSISFLPALYHELLMTLSETIPINYYVLSPCQAFWSDIKSDRESRRLYTFWKAKGASQAQLSALDEFLRDRNPLLANFGRLGREMAEQIETGDCLTEEEYFLPAPLADTPPYAEMVGDDVVLEDVAGPISMLDCVHADLTFLRNPLESDKITMDPDDRTIQLHVSPTKRREVEVLYDVLMGIIDRHKDDQDPITPGDIIVMAPDLSVYEPFVKIIFGSVNSPLDCQLMEVELLSQSMFVQAFWQLMDLASGRWDAASLIEIFELPYVQKKHNFTPDDVRKFRLWIKEAGIRWGENAAHCNEILHRELCANPLVDAEQPGTWEGGIDRLLTGLAFTAAGGEVISQCAPLEVVENSSAELLGRWIEFLKALRDDLKPLQEGALLSMEQWVTYLKALMDAYLMLDTVDKDEWEHREELINELDKLSLAANTPNGHRYAYQSVKIYVEQVLQAKRVNYREGHLKAVRFCSMLPMRALPAKVVVLLGMQDSAFPKMDVANGLDLLREQADADYAPIQGDFDRSLFLESILSARKYFVMSYCGYEGGREEAASVLVTELMTYLDTAYEISGQKPSDLCVFTHPLHAFDASSFRQDGPFPCYSSRAFAAANAYYHYDKAVRHRFIPDFKQTQADAACKGINHPTYLVDIRDLSRMSKNPMQAYFNKTLGMYVNEASSRHVEVDETFDLDHLGMYILKEKSLFADAETILHQSKKEGMLPSGLFKGLITQKLKEQAATVSENLLKMGVDKSSIFTITLADHCEHPMQTDSGWRCPPLHVSLEDGSTFKIVGALKNVVPEGLLVFKKASLKDIVQVWPQFLSLHALIHQHGLPIKPQLLLIKDGKICSFEGLDLAQSFREFLTYYTVALNEISPLIPEWVQSVLRCDAPGLEKIMLDNFGKSEIRFYNEYAKWTFVDQDSIPDAQGIVDHWTELAERVFGPLASALGGKKDHD